MTATWVFRPELLDVYDYVYDDVYAIAFSPNGRMLAVASSPPFGFDSMVCVWTIEPATSTVELKENYVVDGIVRILSFSEDNGYIKTNMGYLPLSGYNEHVPNQDLTCQVYFDNDWIFRGKQRLLWLPPDYRASCEASYNNLYVLGQFSGRVTFIGFNFPVTQTYNKSPLHELRQFSISSISSISSS